MAKPRDGFKARLLEFPVDAWDALDALAASSGVPMIVLAEDAIRRYAAKPPKKLPEPRKKGRPKKAEVGADGGKE